LLHIDKLSGKAWGLATFFTEPERIDERMPDWVHAVLYIAIMTTIIAVTAYYTENIFAVLISMMAGHIFATAVVKRLPGFWNN